MTAAPVYVTRWLLCAEASAFRSGAQLLLVHEGSAEPLVKGFAATADANVYFDGKLVLFAGKKAAGDAWQIWELALDSRAVRKVITTASDAERPLYLPGGRMVWAERTDYGFQLQSARPYGHQPKYSEQIPRAGTQAVFASDLRGRCERVFPLTCLRTGAFFLKPAFRWVRDRFRNCIWSMPMDQVLSRTAAITAGRVGVERSWPQEMLCSRTVQHWRGSRLRWRTRRKSPLPT